RPSAVGGEIVPIIVKINAFPTTDQLFGRRSVEPKMPKLRIVIHGLPLVHAWKESIHDNELLYLLGKLGGVCVSDHQSDVVAYNTRFFYAKGDCQSMHADSRRLHVKPIGRNAGIANSRKIRRD